MLTNATAAMLALLLRFSVRLFPVCLGCVLCALITGQQQKATLYPDLEHYGMLTCRLPCTIGITPGRTPPQDVQTRLLAHIPALEAIQIYSPGSINFSAMYRGRTVTGNVRHRGDTVTAVAVSSVELPLTYLMTQAGQPACVEYIPTSMGVEGLVLYWQWETAAAATILINSPASALHNEMSTTTDWRVTMETAVCRGKLPWRGLLPLWKYAFLAQNP